MLSYKDVRIHWLGHDCYHLQSGKIHIYIDPFRLTGSGNAGFAEASAVLLTHEHFDHLSIEDIKKVAGSDTIIVCPKQCEQQLEAAGFENPAIIQPGQKKEVLGLVVHAVPAYNTNKYRDPSHVFHPKEDGKVGYVIELAGVVIYHAGDTDQIPEMDNIKCDIALLPVSGTYVMTAVEAAHAAIAIKPKIAIPMHYGTIVGTVTDAWRFAEILKSAGITVEILEKEQSGFQ